MVTLRKGWYAAICVWLVSACAPYDEEASRAKVVALSDFHQRTVTLQRDRTMNLVYTGDVHSEVAVIFIHGAPGSWPAWAEYLSDTTLRARALLIAVDRPGYGRSNPGMWEPSLARQASDIIEAAAPLLQDKNVIVVGHSFGGPVALQLALDFPDRIHAALLLAASVDPALEEVTWYQSVVNTAIGAALVPEPFVVATKEIIPLKTELKQQTPRLATLAIPLYVIHGENDSLVPAGNVAYVKRNALNASVETQIIADEGHYLPWKRKREIQAAITALIDTR